MLVLDALFDHIQQISSNVEIIGSLVLCSPISAIDVRVGARAGRPSSAAIVYTTRVHTLSPRMPTARRLLSSPILESCHEASKSCIRQIGLAGTRARKPTKPTWKSGSRSCAPVGRTFARRNMGIWLGCANGASGRFICNAQVARTLCRYGISARTKSLASTSVSGCWALPGERQRRWVRAHSGYIQMS
jgi:hypothetical protein